jgi:hypothetical protein
VTGQLLTARAVADVLAVTPATVLRWTRQGDLRGLRLPSGQIRYREDWLEEDLAQRATPGRGVSAAPQDAAQPVPYVLSAVPEDEE